MTFRVERLPAGVKVWKTRYLFRQSLIDSFPFDVEVEAEPRGEYASPCDCATVYRITDLEWLRKRELLRRGLTANPCVCGCMGDVVAVSVAA